MAPSPLSFGAHCNDQHLGITRWLRTLASLGGLYSILVVWAEEAAAPLVSAHSHLSVYQTLIMGSSDYCVWTRGPADDYNRLAKISGDSGWNWNNLLPYFKKVCYLPFYPLHPILLTLVDIVFSVGDLCPAYWWSKCCRRLHPRNPWN